MSATAALVDYGIVPRRLSPGWEGPLPPASVPGGFVGLFAGLVLGGLLNSSAVATRRARADRSRNDLDVPAVEVPAQSSLSSERSLLGCPAPQ